MGPENSNAKYVAYIDGGPVVIGRTFPEITPDYSAGGVSAEDAAEKLAAMTRELAGASATARVAVKGIQEFFYAVELATALHFAKVLEPAMAHRYLHTKKKRIRKKYEKRIMAWFREVFL